jgi:transcriptional regulator with XRE-family HTH domain
MRSVTGHQQLIFHADRVREVLAALSLNKSQLADVLGVSRPTLYDWFEGKEPNSANAGRLIHLLRLLSRSGISSTTPLNARFVRQPINDRDSSLVDELSAEQWNEKEIEKILVEARNLSENAELLQREREKRWNNLGYEKQSEIQRREQLNRNIAMLDWPKR